MEIVDRRHGSDSRAEEERAAEVVGELINRPPDILEQCDQVHGEKLRWVEIAYLVTLMQVGGMGIITGRVVGLRSDGYACSAFVVLNPLWKDGATGMEGGHWITEARSRLETFLNCGCTKDRACGFHASAVRGWIEEGLQRVKSTTSKPVPGCIKVMNSQEQELASRIQIAKPGDLLGLQKQ